MAEETGRRRWRRWAVLLVIVALAVFMYWPTRESIRISPQTTVVDGPLNADGTVNYVAAMDRAWAEGVTPENNAAILLLQALGPEILPQATREKVSATLGVSFDPNGGEYYVTWDGWLKAHRPAATQPQTQPGEEATSEPAMPMSLADVLEMLQAGQDVPEIREWLEDNKQPLDLIVAATQRPRYYVPLVSASSPPQVISLQLPALSCCRDVARALAARAELEARAGQVEAAWQDLLAAHRLARLIEQGPTLIEQLVALAIERTASDAGRTIATRGECTSEQARGLLAELVKLPPVGDVVGSIDRGERFMLLDCVTVICRGGEMEGLYTAPARWLNPDFNTVLTVCNDYYDRTVQAARTESPVARGKVSDAVWQSIDAELERRKPSSIARLLLLTAGGRITRQARSRELARLLLHFFLPSLTKAVDFQDATRMATEIEKLALALAAYRGGHGRWPDRLEQLVPDYLPAIPPDRFADAPLIYRPGEKGYLLYSVGFNQRDDGGVDDYVEGRDDIVAEVK